MVKYNTARLYNLSKDNYRNKIKSGRIKKKRDKIINSIKKIQIKYRNYLKKRYNFLENNIDTDLISGENIYSIPEWNLHIYEAPNNKKYGIKASTYLEWFTYTKTFNLPINIFTNKKMTLNEYKKVIEKVDECYEKCYYGIEEKEKIKQHLNICKSDYICMNDPTILIEMLEINLSQYEDNIRSYIEYMYGYPIDCICPSCIYNVFRIDDSHFIQNNVIKYEQTYNLLKLINERINSNYYC